MVAQARIDVLLMGNSPLQIIYEFYGGNLRCLRKCPKSTLRIFSIVGEKPDGKTGWISNAQEISKIGRKCTQMLIGNF